MYQPDSDNSDDNISSPTYTLSEGISDGSNHLIAHTSDISANISSYQTPVVIYVWSRAGKQDHAALRTRGAKWYDLRVCSQQTEWEEPPPILIRARLLLIKQMETGLVYKIHHPNGQVIIDNITDSDLALPASTIATHIANHTLEAIKWKIIELTASRHHTREEGIYVSFYPKDSTKSLSMRGYFSQTKSFDWDKHHYEIRKKIKIGYLDIEKIEDRFKDFLRSGCKFSLFASSILRKEGTQNCVGLSLELLNAGDFQRYIEHYYSYGLLAGSLASLPMAAFCAYMLYEFKLGVEWDDTMAGWAPGLCTTIGPIAIGLASIIGILPKIGLSYVSKSRGHRATKGLANLIGAFLLGGLAMIDHITFSNTRDYNFFKTNWIWQAQCYSNYGAISMLKIPALAFLGAWIGGKLFKKKEDADVFDPGFLAGFSSSLPAALTGMVTTLFVAILTNKIEKFFKIAPFNPLMRFEREFGIINTLCGFLITLTASYLGSKIFNHILYKSIHTPKDLYRMAQHASYPESFPAISKEESVIGENKVDVASSSFSKFIDNKHKIMSGICIIAAVGFFATRNSIYFSSIRSTIDECIKWKNPSSR